MWSKIITMLTPMTILGRKMWVLKPQKLLLAALFLGVTVRVLLYLVYPSFNGDEIALGENIRNRGFLDLLRPLDCFQSAPPLYLLLQHVIICQLPFEFWINIRLLSFVASVGGLLLFYNLIKNTTPLLAIFMLVIFAFNPYIVENSLTVKQYTIDLVGVLILLNYRKSTLFVRYNCFFFCVWCLFSNVGLFGTAGFLLYNLLSRGTIAGARNLWDYAKGNLLTILAPVPYLVYVLWYMRQDGAVAMKMYMVSYWSDSFIPFNGQMLKYSLYLVHGFWTYFYNAYEIVGLPLFLVALCVIPLFFNKKEFLFKNDIWLLGCVAFFNLLLTACHLYPFCDRLYLYLAPFFIFILSSSLFYHISGPRLRRVRSHVMAFLIIINIICYATYLPHQENDVVSLYKKLGKYKISQNIVYASPTALEGIAGFNRFTDNYFSKNQKIQFRPLDHQSSRTGYLVSKVSHKFGPKEKTSREDEAIQQLIDDGIIVLVDKVDGYNCYKIR